MLTDFPFSDIELFLVRAAALLLLIFGIYKVLEREKPKFKSRLGPVVLLAVILVLVVLALLARDIPHPEAAPRPTHQQPKAPNPVAYHTGDWV